MASLPTKRKRHPGKAAKDDNPSSTVPSINLTRAAMEEFFDVQRWTDRQRLSWALQTEARVRLEKLKSRDAPSAVSHTLDSEVLFDIYPSLQDNAQPKKKAAGKKKAAAKPSNKKAKPSRKKAMPRDCTPPESHVQAWKRKSHPCLQKCRRPDESIVDSLPKLDMSRHERFEHVIASNDTGKASDEASLYDPAPVPPNLLFFEIILEAYIGYSLKRHFHSDNPNVPRCAIQGGAVVAALTAWRDSNVLEVFQLQNLDRFFDTNTTEANYTEALNRLRILLHYYFQHKAEQSQFYDSFEWPATSSPYETENLHSPFSKGDVDVFAQVSPLTRSLLQKFNDTGLDEAVRDKIGSFIGGGGFQEQDLQRLSDALFDSEAIKESFPFRCSRDVNECELIYALTRNALSFMMTYPNETCRPIDIENLCNDSLWPRNTQLIMLSEKADLVGGLLDFDLSLVVCSYDGNGVRVAPRAAFSLLTSTLVVTPFVLEEKRNWQRMVKYFKRGFEGPYVLDPNCEHSSQCATGPFGWQADDGTDSEEHGLNQRSDPDLSEEVTEYQCNNEKVFCCGHVEHNNIYTPFLFEERSNDFLEFVFKRDKWTEEEKAEILDSHPWSRMCCRECRYDYTNYTFVRKNQTYGENIELYPDELLQGDRSYARTRAFRSIFSPSFYSGGVFDGLRNRFQPYYAEQAFWRLDSQLKAEEARYFDQNDTYDGYCPRYAFGFDRDDLFKKASGVLLSKAKRNPVGLNPERFISSCESCASWLLGAEFGTRYCEICESRKPRGSR